MKLFQLVNIAAASVLCCVAGANATTLTLPSPSAAAFPVGDFTVYSLDLLAQCAAAGDPNCVPNAGLPVSSSQINDELVIMDFNKSSNYPPLTAAPSGGPADEPFDSPTGNGAGSSEFVFKPGNEPGGKASQFSGDRIGTWEVQIGALYNYITSGGAPFNLVFLFGNTQNGTAAGDTQWIFATASILDGAGNIVGGNCYRLAANGYSGTCTSATTTANPVAPSFSGGVINNPLTTNYTAMGSVCVDKTLGSARPVPSGGCDANEYYVSNNLGNSTAEFAAINPNLSAAIANLYQTNPNYVLSVDIDLANLNGGGEVAWILGPQAGAPTHVPEPGSLALVGLAMAAGAMLRRRQR